MSYTKGLIFALLLGFILPQISIAHAQNQEILPYTSFGSTSSNNEFFVISDDTGFWSIDSGGIGNIDINIDEDASTVKRGSSSLRYQVVSGGKAWVNIQHGYSVAEDWSGYENIAFWWYGQNSGASFSVTVEAGSYSNRFTHSFSDDFSGWQLVSLPLSSFNRVNSASWSSVRKILIIYSSEIENAWLLDTTYLSKSMSSPPEPVVSGNLQILRYAAHTTIEQQYRRDSSYISNYADLYMCWSWDSMVAKTMPEHIPVLEYKNWHSAPDYSEEFQLALANGWALIDENGAYVYEKGWPENKILDPGSQSFKEYLAEWVGNSLSNGFDGVWADNSNSIYPQTLWRLSAKPINPRTGVTYTDEAWLNDHIELINYVKAVHPDAFFSSNGMLYNGFEFFKDLQLYEKFLEEADMNNLFVEGIFNRADGSPYSENDWKKSVDLVVWLQNNYLDDSDKTVVLRSQSKGTSIPTSPDEVSEFIIASCLLGVSSMEQNYVSTMYNMESSYTQALFSVEFGVPTEDYHLIEGTRIYEREFTKVKILVNPTGSTYNIDLGIEYTTVNGVPVASIEMTPFKGIILITP